MIIRSDVVLPAPLGPINPYSAPLGTTRSRSRTATVVPNVLLTPLSEIAGSISQSGAPQHHMAVGDLFPVHTQRSGLRSPSHKPNHLIQLRRRLGLFGC